MRSRSDRIVLATLLAGALAWPAIARADDEPAAAPAAEAEDPEVVALRERFKVGMDRYKAGAYAEAILEWESVYRALGREKGYRLAFNLARAYDAYGDATRAAERYQLYLDEVAAKRARGEPLEEVVLTQEEDAKTRLAELAKTRARIHVTSPTPREASVDRDEPRLAGFVAYVRPGRHTITFGRGDDATRVEVDVSAGELREVSPPPPAPTEVAPPPPPPPPPPRLEARRERPYPAYVLFIGAGATAASVVVPALMYSRALGVYDEHEASRDPAERARLANDYFSARSTAYATLAIPATLGAATLGLTAYWLFGGTERLVPVGSASATGGTLGVRGAF